MKNTYRILLMLACLGGAMSVLSAAYVAHLPGLGEATLRSLQSAMQMLQFHALALLVVAWMGQDERFRWPLFLSAWFFLAGILMFSVNILLNQLFGMGLFKPLTPFGGMAFVLGWLALGLSVMKKKSPEGDL